MDKKQDGLVKPLKLNLMEQKKQELAEQTIECVSSVLELYSKKVKGEAIDNEKLEQYKHWFKKMIDY